MQDRVNPVPDATETPPMPRADLATFPLDDELVVYDPQSTESFVLNPTGRIVWSLCDGTRTPQAIASELSASFDTTYEQALADTLDLLRELHAARLLDWPASR